MKIAICTPVHGDTRADFTMSLARMIYTTMKSWASLGRADAPEIEMMMASSSYIAGNRERLVEPYMTTREKGTGLGLAIVQRIVEQHGGTLTLADAPKRNGKMEGASVRIDLPVGDREEASATEPETPAEAGSTERADEEEGVTHGV